jgi:hypothetical protein
MGRWRRANEQLRFPVRRIETLRSMRTSSLVRGAVFIVLAVVTAFDGKWVWVATAQFAVGAITFAQGVLADVELNRREHGNYPPSDPDGLLKPVDVAGDQSF